MKPVQQIKQMLSDLSAKDLKQVEMLAKQYRVVKGFKTDRPEEGLLYECAVLGVLASKLKTGYPFFGIFTKQQPENYTKLREVSLELDEWIDAQFPDILRARKVKLYTLFAEIVTEYIETGPVPLSLPTMLNAFPKLPGLVDKKFPGYLQNNLLFMLLTEDNFEEEK